MAQPIKAVEAPESTDPRVLRSRRMLMDSLVRLLSKKEFEDISIQEIADEATLNRATFYLHYPDKNALLRAMTAERFRDLIARRGLSFTDCDGALRAIALGVCDYLAETTGCPSQLSKMPLESSVIPVVEDIFREGASHHPAQLAPGFRHLAGFPLRKWLPKLKPWLNRCSSALPRSSAGLTQTCSMRIVRTDRIVRIDWLSGRVPHNGEPRRLFPHRPSRRENRAPSWQ
jgi:AcrR family transcriptional regulator